MADKDNKDEITPVGPGADEDVQTADTQTDEGTGYTYAEVDDDDSPGRQESTDERTGHAETHDRDGLSENQRRRRRKRERFEETQRELAFLRARNEQLERQRSQELASI